jgi:predicted nuclease of predicted toxin-antitoxin system
MRFKLDENLSRSIAEIFRTRGHDVMTVRDQELQGASDEQVFEVSVREGRTLVTLDRDLDQVRFPARCKRGDRRDRPWPAGNSSGSPRTDA